MKQDLSLEIAERRGITRSFRTRIEPTPLIATDITDHRYWLQEVYSKVFIHEACVFDDCLRRFERAFKGWN